MAREKKVPVKNRSTVPVRSRSHLSGAGPRRWALPKGKLDIAGIGVIIAVVLLVLLTIASPLRNYYHVRAETARLESSIAAKQARKDALLEEIEKYRDEDYIQQQARRRFGVMGPGETAFRIIDPRMRHENTVTTNKLEEQAARPWTAVLWDSLATPPEDSPAASAPTSLNLPTEQPAPPGQPDE